MKGQKNYAMKQLTKIQALYPSPQLIEFCVQEGLILCQSSLDDYEEVIGSDESFDD